MAPTNPPATADDPVSATTAIGLIYSIPTTDGVYIYTDTGVVPQAPGFTATAAKAAIAANTDVGKACVANSTTLAAIVADATSIATLRANATIIAAVQADNHVFPTTLSHKVQVKVGGATIRNTADLDIETNIVVRLAAATVLYINAKAYVTDTGLLYKILDGTYANDYVDREEIEFAPLEVRF